MVESERLQGLRIVIAGGSGHVGQLLAQHFHDGGNSVTVLSRHPEAAPWKVLFWNGRTPGAWTELLDGADVCINLAGRTVNTRSTPRHREEIYKSRIESTRLLGEVIAQLQTPPRVWLNASTATIYRHALDRGMDESTGEMGGHEPGVPASWSFSVKVGVDWEKAFFDANTPHTRRVALRTSLVMSAQRGSVFDVLSHLVRFRLGGRNGKGTQRVSWIHAQDFIRAVDLFIQDERWSGPVNLAAPAAPTNSEFMLALRDAWKVRVGLPASEWMIRVGTFLLRTEPELVMKSRWVLPGRLQDAGFEFLYPSWPVAVQSLVAEMRSRK